MTANIQYLIGKTIHTIKRDDNYPHNITFYDRGGIPLLTVDIKELWGPDGNRFAADPPMIWEWPVPSAPVTTSVNHCLIAHMTHVGLQLCDFQKVYGTTKICGTCQNAASLPVNICQQPCDCPKCSIIRAPHMRVDSLCTQHGTPHICKTGKHCNECGHNKISGECHNSLCKIGIRDDYHLIKPDGCTCATFRDASRCEEACHMSLLKEVAKPFWFERLWKWLTR